MNPEFLLPGTVVLFKSALRLMVDRQVTGLLFAKAFLAFPIDITFLSFSYGAALLISAQHRGASWPTGFLLGLIVAYALLGTLINLACSKADRAFDAERNWVTFFISLGCYIFAFGILYATLFSGFLDAGF